MSKVTDKVIKLLEKVANAHLYEVMGNKGRYIDKPANFSTVQYMNARGHVDQLKLKEMIVRSIIDHVGKSEAFLNMGTACGHLEYANKLNHEQLTISSCEWDYQYECCEKIRDMLGIQISYRCNDILSDDFEIRNCKTYFDHVILDRFFPVYQADTHHRTEEVLKKFKPYAKRAIIVESDGNWSKEQWAWLTKTAERRIKISGEWNMFLIKLENL